MKMMVAVLLLALGILPAWSAPMTQLERQRLVAHFEMTGNWLADEVSGLSVAQLQFHPDPNSWSILQTVEHLVVTEPIYWKNLHDALNSPSKPSRSGSDDGVLWYGIDRTQRQKAIAGEGAPGKLRDPAAGLEAFRKLRAQMLDYAKTTTDDLRGHYVQREGSDAYQWLLLISTHSQRHILQIREIKADPKYPKK
jgi:hypothetical protein